MAKQKKEAKPEPPIAPQVNERQQLAELELKVVSGEKLKYQEQRIFDRLVKKRDAEIFAKQIEQVSKKLWMQWSGRDHRVLLDQARKYGMPLGETTVSVPEMAQWIHDLVAEQGRNFYFDEEDEGGISSKSSPALERLREAKASMAEQQLAKECRQLIERNVVHDGLQQIAGTLRRCGDVLQRQYGREVGETFNEFIDDCDRQISEFLAALAGDTDDDSE